MEKLNWWHYFDYAHYAKVLEAKNKQLKKLKLHHDYLNRKVAEVTELRLHDRSIESKTILMRLKKEKLALKDQITELEKQLVKK